MAATLRRITLPIVELAGSVLADALLQLQCLVQSVQRDGFRNNFETYFYRPGSKVHSRTGIRSRAIPPTGYRHIVGYQIEAAPERQPVVTQIYSLRVDLAGDHA